MKFNREFQESLFENEMTSLSTVSSIQHFVELERSGELNLTPVYQREYVYTEKEQQAIIHTVIQGRPLGNIAITSSPNGRLCDYCIIVDGKQRLTTLLLFINNKIPYKTKKGDIYYRDFEKVFQMAIKHYKLNQNILEMKDGSDVPLKNQAEYFFNVNFAGVPQDEKHIQKVLELIN